MYEYSPIIEFAAPLYTPIYCVLGMVHITLLFVRSRFDFRTATIIY